MHNTRQRILGIVPVGAGITVEYDLWGYRDDASSYAPQSVVGLAVVEVTAPDGSATTCLRPVVSHQGLLDESDPALAGMVFEGLDAHPVQVARHTQSYIDTYVALMGELPAELP